MNDDPIKHCNLYKGFGCSHVDGYLCDFTSCSMRLNYEQVLVCLEDLDEGADDE